jgi:hypothetical protein
VQGEHAGAHSRRYEQPLGRNRTAAGAVRKSITMKTPELVSENAQR